MASVSLFVFFVLSHLVLLHSAEGEGKQEHPYCLPFQCGKFGNISFPFTENPDPFCGLHVECDETPLMIHLPLELPWAWSKRKYEVLNIFSIDTTPHIRVKDLWLSEDLWKTRLNLEQGGVSMWLWSTACAYWGVSYSSSPLTHNIKRFDSFKTSNKRSKNWWRKSLRLVWTVLHCWLSNSRVQ